MTYIPQQVVPLFESGIYLPMLLAIVNHDIDRVQESSFKFKTPYLQLLHEVRLKLEQDLIATKQQFKQHKMKLKKGVQDTMFTEYYFYYQEIVELRRYSNIRLRNQSEHLFREYLHLRSVMNE